MQKTTTNVSPTNLTTSLHLHGPVGLSSCMGTLHLALRCWVPETPCHQHLHGQCMPTGPSYWAEQWALTTALVRSLFPPQGFPLFLFPFMVKLLKKLSAFLLSISPLSHSIRLLSPPFHHSHSCKPLISMSPKASSPSCLDPFLLPLFLIHSLAPSRSPPLLPALNHWGPGAQPWFPPHPTVTLSTFCRLTVRSQPNSPKLYYYSSYC